MLGRRINSLQLLQRTTMARLRVSKRLLDDMVEVTESSTVVKKCENKFVFLIFVQSYVTNCSIFLPAGADLQTNLAPYVVFIDILKKAGQVVEGIDPDVIFGYLRHLRVKAGYSYATSLAVSYMHFRLVSNT